MTSKNFYELIELVAQERNLVVEDVMEKAKAAYVAEGHRACAIKSVRLYIKPEERKAYYVINDKAAGSIEL